MLKVRETEDEDSKVLTSLNNGEKVSLVERGGNGSWKVYVEAEEVTGYLDYHYLTNDRDAAMEPISRYVSVGEDEELTILSSSEGDGSSVGILERGDEVTVLALPDKEYAYIYAAEAKAYGYIDRSKLAEEKPAEVKDEEDDDQSGATTSGQTAADLIGPGTPPARDLGVYYVMCRKATWRFVMPRRLIPQMRSVRCITEIMSMCSAKTENTGMYIPRSLVLTDIPTRIIW